MGTFEAKTPISEGSANDTTGNGLLLYKADAFILHGLVSLPSQVLKDIRWPQYANDSLSDINSCRVLQHRYYTVLTKSR